MKAKSFEEEMSFGQSFVLGFLMFLAYLFQAAAMIDASYAIREFRSISMTSPGVIFYTLSLALLFYISRQLETWWHKGIIYITMLVTPLTVLYTYMLR